MLPLFTFGGSLLMLRDAQGKGSTFCSDFVKGKGKKRPADAGWGGVQGADAKRMAMKCYNCHGYGHFAADCPKPPAQKTD